MQTVGSHYYCLTIKAYGIVTDVSYRVQKQNKKHQIREKKKKRKREKEWKKPFGSTLLGTCCCHTSLWLLGKFEKYSHWYVVISKYFKLIKFLFANSTTKTLGISLSNTSFFSFIIIHPNPFISLYCCIDTTENIWFERMWSFWSNKSQAYHLKPFGQFSLKVLSIMIAPYFYFYFYF